MKKLIAIIAFLLMTCTPRPEIIKDPIHEENYIQFNECGKTEIIQDPLFPENYLVFPDCENQEK